MNAKSPLHVFVQDSSTVGVAISPLNANQAFTCSNPSSYATKTNTTTNSVTFGGNSEGIVGVTVTSAGNSSVKVNYDIVVITQFASMQGRIVGSQYLWTGPSDAYQPVPGTSLLPVNQNVTIYGSYGAYYYINAGGYVGFVLKSNVGITVYMSDNAEELTSADLTFADYTKTELETVSNISSVDTGRTEAWHRDNFWGLCALSTPNGSTMYNLLNSMHTQFCGGTVIPQTATNPLGAYTNNSLTSVLRKRADVKTYESVTIACLQEALSEVGGNLRTIQYVEGEADNLFTQLLKTNRDALTFGGFGNFADGFLIAIHSMWGSRLEVKDYQLSGNSYSGTLTFYLYDHFGLSAGDMSWKTNFNDGFASWFILQHYSSYSGYRPFVTLMKYDVNFSGTL